VIDIVATVEFEAWFLGLETADSDAVIRVVNLLEERGISLGFPYSSDIKVLYIFHIFDPMRQAVLLLGGDKSSRARFYQSAVPKAEQAYFNYLAAIGTPKR